MTRRSLTLHCRSSNQPGVLEVVGTLSGPTSEIETLFPSPFWLEEVDSRLSGRVIIPALQHGAETLTVGFIADGPVTVDGRALKAGDHVSVTVGGEIAWAEEELLACYCGMMVPRSLWRDHGIGHTLGLDGRREGYFGRGVWKPDKALAGIDLSKQAGEGEAKP